MHFYLCTVNTKECIKYSLIITQVWAEPVGYSVFMQSLDTLQALDCNNYVMGCCFYFYPCRRWTVMHAIMTWDVTFTLQYQIFLAGIRFYQMVACSYSDVAFSDQALYHCTATNPVSGVTRTSMPAQLTAIGMLASCTSSRLHNCICPSIQPM